MPSPWDDKQKPNQRSEHHGKKDHKHNDKEKGLGGRIPPGQAKKLGIEDPENDQAVAVGEVMAGGDVLAGAYPSWFYIPNKPPISNQGMTSRCVSHYSASDQGQHDRPEMGRFPNYDIAKFATRIGTTSAGAYISVANQERKDTGYPTIGPTDASKHRIDRAIDVPETIGGVKNALYQYKHGVGFLLPWFHSWFHTLASGKLPAPDYHVGYHMIYCDGWNDNLGFALRNSWGTEYGANGRCYLPYAHLWRSIVIQRTSDR